MEGLQNNKFYSEGAKNKIESYYLYKYYKRLKNDPEKYFNDLLEHNHNLILDTNLFIPIGTDLLTYALCNNNMDDFGIYSLSKEDLFCKSKNYKNLLCGILEKTYDIKVTDEVLKEVKLERRHWEKTLQAINDKNIKISDNKKSRLFKKLSDFSRDYIDYLSDSHNNKLISTLSNRILNTNEINISEDIKNGILNCDVNCSYVDKDLFLNFCKYNLKSPCTLVSEDEHIKFISISVNNMLRTKSKQLIENKMLFYKEHWHGFTTYLVDFYYAPFRNKQLKHETHYKS